MGEVCVCVSGGVCGGVCVVGMGVCGWVGVCGSACVHAFGCHMCAYILTRHINGSIPFQCLLQGTPSCPLQGTAASELLEQLDFLLHVYREKKDFSKFVVYSMSVNSVVFNTQCIREQLSVYTYVHCECCTVIWAQRGVCTYVFVQGLQFIWDTEGTPIVFPVLVDALCLLG